MKQSNIPIDVVHLLPVLDKKLINLLNSLAPGEWDQQTIAKLWTVKDVAVHLLDGNIRILSILRDGYFGEQANANSHQELVDFLNRLNADWVKAMKRVSPRMIIFLLEVTGPLFCDYFKSLNPLENSLLAVDWAGETESKNWMEIGREYSEKWLHQQQIRDAVNKPGLMIRELYYPFIDIFMLALPHTYRHTQADNGATVKMTVTTEIGGSWYLTRTEGRWILSKNFEGNPSCELIIDPETAWKLFSKSWRHEDVRNKIVVHGDHDLAEPALRMVSVMA